MSKGKSKKKRSLVTSLFGHTGESHIGFRYGSNGHEDNGYDDRKESKSKYSSYGSYYGNSWSSGWNNWDWYSWKGKGESVFTKTSDEKFRILKSTSYSSDIEKLGDAIVAYDPKITERNNIPNQTPDKPNLSPGTPFDCAIQHKLFGESWMVEDLMNLFFSENKFDKITFTNQWWKEMIDYFDDYLLKDLTKDNYFFSSIILSHILREMKNMFNNDPEKEKAIQNACQQGMSQDQKDKQDKEQQSQQSQQSDKGEKKDNQQQQQNGQGQGDRQDQQDSSQQNSPGKGQQQGKSTRTDLSQDVRDQLEEMQQKLKDAMRKGISDATKQAAIFRKMGLEPSDMKDKETVDAINDLKEMVKAMNLNKRDVMGFVNRSIRGMKKSVKGACNTFEEDLFDSDAVEDLDDFVNLVHPSLYSQLAVIENDPSIKFDIYVDCSGSMSSACSLNMQRMTAAKMIALKMRAMGILNNIYPYEGKVHPGFSSQRLGKIFSMRASGGTEGDKCVENIKLTGIPAMIITDGDDTFSEYSNMAYVMCIESPIRVLQEAEKFMYNKQLVLFKNKQFQYITK